MEDQRHFIQKQKLIFDFRNEEKAIAWHREASSFFYIEVLPLLNHLFNKHIPADRLYSIDSLEIDLGKTALCDLKQSLFKHVDAKLSDLITRKSEDVPEDPEMTSVESLLDTTLVKDVRTKVLEVFYTFLDYGVLAWNSNFDRLDRLEESVTNEIGVEGLTRLPDFQRRIERPIIRRRLFHQFSPSFVQEVFRMTFSREFEAIELFKTFLREKLRMDIMDTPSNSIIGKIISVDTLSWVVFSEQARAATLVKDVIHTMISKIEQELQREYSDQYETYLHRLLHFDGEGNLFHALAQVLNIAESYPAYYRIVQKGATATHSAEGSGSKEELTAGTQRQTESSAVDDPVIQASKDFGSNTTQTLDESIGLTNVGSSESKITGETDNPFTPPPHPDPRDRMSAEAKDERQLLWKSKKEAFHPANAVGNSEKSSDRSDALAEYYVMNAGIVLCWPYLNLLFDRLGYLVSSDFRNHEQQERAVHLLGYIASGHEKCEEHELTIQKFLAGWPLQMPLIKELKLIKKEKRECEKMLQGMISNWPILKNTSVEGLRSSFFQRNGILRKEEGAWRLVVEQKSYDMLLDHLSYGIGIIKLPWFRELLKVDWA